MKLKTILMLAAVAGTLYASAIETSIAYQGVLRDAQGKELSSLSQEITFRLYTQASGGTPLWARAIAVNLDKTGLFNVELNDSGTSVDATAQHLQLSDALKAARGGSLYIGLEVKDSSPENNHDALFVMGGRCHFRRRRFLGRWQGDGEKY